MKSYTTTAATLAHDLSLAAAGNADAQAALCQWAHEHPDAAGALPADLRAQLEVLAREGADYACFVLHCACSPAEGAAAFDYIRRAVRSRRLPLAFTRLGTCYAEGIGTTANTTLASYFFEKARILGDAEAASAIERLYATGVKDLAAAVASAIDIVALAEAGALENPAEAVAPEILSRFRGPIENARLAHDNGILSRLRHYLPFFYPDYSPEAAIRDLRAGRDSRDADLFLALSTDDNNFEENVPLLEDFLQQLYAPVLTDETLLHAIRQTQREQRYEWNNLEHDIVQVIQNFAYAYPAICQNYHVRPAVRVGAHLVGPGPYMTIAQLQELRRQAVLALLSLIDALPLIRDKVLPIMNQASRMLDLSEGIMSQELQLLLISYVELHIDVDSLENTYQQLLHAFRHQQPGDLVIHLNDYADRLTRCGIGHRLPAFTLENLPAIHIA